VDDSAKDISALHGSSRQYYTRDWALLIDALMGTRSVVVLNKINQDAPWMSSIDDRIKKPAALPTAYRPFKASR